MNWIELAHFGFFLATVLVSVYLLRCALVFLGILVVACPLPLPSSPQSRLGSCESGRNCSA